MDQTRRRMFGFLPVSVLMGVTRPLFAATAPPPFSDPHTTAPAKIVISTKEHKLYYYDAEKLVATFSIAVGREGRKWSGNTFVARKVLRPKWAPPPIIRKENPKLPAIVGPGPNNPLGAAVLVLGDGNYGIHGTNKESTIGKNVSYGCIRMYNKDILQLFSKVEIGTPVTVMP